MIGNKIKQLRKRAGLTQKEFGEKVNVSGAYIQQLENGVKSNPSLGILNQLATVFNTSLVNLITDQPSIFTFPATIFADKNTIHRQIKHIKSEFEEFIQEYGNVQMEAADMEAMDLYHSLETYFRIRQWQGVDLTAVMLAVQKKNQERGYYDI